LSPIVNEVVVKFIIDVVIESLWEVLIHHYRSRGLCHSIKIKGSIAVGVYWISDCWRRCDKSDTNFIDTVDNLAYFLCIPWDPSKVIIIALVPPNISAGAANITLHVEYVSTQQANSMEVTTVTDKNDMHFNPFNHS
jgi:hypothetical protein